MTGSTYDRQYEAVLQILSIHFMDNHKILQKKIDSIAHTYREDRLYIASLMLSLFQDVSVEKNAEIKNAIKMLEMVAHSDFYKATVSSGQTQLTIIIREEIDVNHMYFLLASLAQYLNR